MLLMVSGRGLHLDSAIINEFRNFGLTPVHVKHVEQNIVNDSNEIVFDLEAGLEFFDLIDRYDFDDRFFREVVPKLKNVDDGFISFVSEESVSNLPAVREFLGTEGLILRFFLLGGSSFEGSKMHDSGEDENDLKIEIKDRFLLQMINKSSSDVEFQRTIENPVSFRIEDLVGEELGELTGDQAKINESIVLNPSDEFQFSGDFSLTAPRGIYKLIPVISGFAFKNEITGKTEETFWTLSPITIILK
ncbi:MAG: hypothetical protein ACXQS8_03595 [Candidatus Helarchaeales archaeon]